VAGRNVNEALDNYHDDLRHAFRCLKTFSRVEFVTPSRTIGATCSWLLIEQSDDVGITLPGCGLRFEASQTLRIEQCDAAMYYGNVRLRTVAYDYSVSEPGQGELWAMHWHPDSQNSQVDYPHMHLRNLLGRGAHLATSR
jgi:hypothetical protein